MLTVDEMNQTEVVLDLKSLNTGMYIVEISDAETFEIVSNTKISKL